MGTPDDIYAHDPTQPAFGSFLNADVVRRSLREIRRNHRSAGRPSTAAQCYADNGKLIAGGTLDLHLLYNVRIAVDGGSYVTVDLRSTGASPATARTLADIVASINAALGATIAVAIDGYLWLISTTTGTSSQIQVNVGATLDAADVLFQWLDRGLTYPASFVGSTAEDGQFHESTAAASAFDTHIDHYLKSAAHFDGAGATFPINLTERWNLTLTFDGGSPVVVNCKTGGASPASARTLADVVAAVNTAVGSTVAFALSGQLQIVSTTLGSASAVVVSESSVNDAAHLLFGRAFGVWPSEVSRFPVSRAGHDWNTDFFRGVEDTPGVGAWGPPLIDKAHLPTTGHTRGEVRWPLLSRVPYIWDSKLPAWVRAVPGIKDHVVYDDVREAYGSRFGVSLGDLTELQDNFVRYALVDDFNRSNAGSLGANWTQSQGKFRIVSNKASFPGSAIGAPPADSDFCIYGAGTPPSNNDMDVWASLALSSDDNSAEAWAGLLFRSTGATSYYWVRVSDRRNGELYSWNGTSSSLISAFTLPKPLGKTAVVLRARIVGTSIKVYWGGAAPTTAGNDVQPPALPATSPKDLDATRWEQDEEAFLVFSITDTTIGTGTRGGIYGKPSAVADALVDDWGYREIVTVAQHQRGLPSVSSRRTRHSVHAVRVVRTETDGEDIDDPTTWAHMPRGTYIQDCRPDEFRTGPTDQALLLYEGPGVKLTGVPSKNAVKIECTVEDVCFNHDQCCSVVMLPPGASWGIIGPPPGYDPLCWTPVATNWIIDPAFFAAVYPGYAACQPTYAPIQAAMVAWATSIYTLMGWPVPDVWQGMDLLYAMLTKLIGGEPQTPVPSAPGVPTLPIPTEDIGDVDGPVNPGLMFAPGTLTTPVYWIPPVETFADLPTFDNDGFVSPQVVPDGLVAVTVDTHKSYAYRQSTDDWVRVDDETFGGVTVKDEGTSVRTDVLKFNFVGLGVTVTDPTIANQVTITIPGAAVVLGSGSGQAADGAHVHGAGGYALIPYATGLSGIPSTFAPSTHALADHSGQLPVARLDFLATNKLLGRATAGAGAAEEISLTLPARTLIAQTTQALMRTTGLGLGALSTLDNAPGALVRAPQILTGSGTYTRPAGVALIVLELVGAGGGGGGAAGGVASAGAGGGGASGSYVLASIASPGGSYSYACGAGGVPGAAGNNNGAAGGDTTFDAFTAKGGGGGSGSGGAAATLSASPGGSPGSGSSSGDLKAEGAPGDPGFRLSGVVSNSGNGGSVSPYGGGGGSVQDAAGKVGSGYGGGGSGASTIGVTDRAGGAGAPGVIIVREYY